MILPVLWALLLSAIIYVRGEVRVQKWKQRTRSMALFVGRN